MPRKNVNVWDAPPHRPIRYNPIARLSDRTAGRRDGRRGIPKLPDEPAGPQLVTPYLAIHNHRYGDCAAAEFKTLNQMIEPLVTQRSEVEGQLRQARQDAQRAAQRLADIPATAPESVLTQRNAVETDADENLVRARRQREYTAARAQPAAEEKAADDRVRSLTEQLARIDGAILAHKQIASSRTIRQLEHTLRRCRTYERLLIRHHPDGPALVPLLELSRPQLPSWVITDPT